MGATKATEETLDHRIGQEISFALSRYTSSKSYSIVAFCSDSYWSECKVMM